MRLRKEEIEVQNRANLARLAVSLEENVDLSEIQNAAETKMHLSFLSNENFHIMQSPKISSPLNHKKYRLSS